MKNETIKELKSDIIRYGEIFAECEDQEFPENIIRTENLSVTRDGGILYSCYEIDMDDGKESSGAVIIYDSVEEFLKTPIKEIIKRINEAHYYNVREVA